MKTILWNVFEIAVNLYQGFVMMFFPFKYLGGKYSEKFKNNYGLIFSVLLALNISIFNHIASFEHILALSYGVMIFLFSLIFLKGTLQSKIFISVLSLIIVLLSSAAIAGLVSVIFDKPMIEVLQNNDWQRALGVILTQLFIAYLMAFSLKLLKRQNKNNVLLSGKENLLISFTLLFSLLVGSILCLVSFDDISYRNRILMAIGFIILIIINIITILITVDIQHKNLSVIENEKLKLQLTYNKQYIENADAEYELIRKLRHDTKNIYHIIDNYLIEKDIDNARNYIKKAIDIADDHIVFVTTQNKVVNAIINAKLTVAKSLGIKATCLCIDDFDGIDDIDICRLLSNMLDNAIAATSQNKEQSKKMHLKISCDSNIYAFRLENSIDRSVLQENPDLHTTNTQYDKHGYGVKIIKEISKKYNGHCVFFEEDKTFCTLVTLYPELN